MMWTDNRESLPNTEPEKLAPGVESSRSNDSFFVRAQVIPRLGVLSGLLLLSIVLWQVVLLRFLEDAGDLTTMFFLSSVWSGWSICLWLIVAQPFTLTRLLLMTLALSWHCLLLFTRSNLPIERYLVLLGTYGIVLVSLKLLFRVPQWRCLTRDQRDVRRPQFNILMIITLTTGCAIVLYAARRHEEFAQDHFFAKTTLSMLALSVVSVSAMYLSTTRLRLVFGLAIVTMLAFVSSKVIAAIEAWTVEGLDDVLRASLETVYVPVISAIGCIVFLFGSFGQFDASIRSIPDRVESTPIEPKSAVTKADFD